MKFNLRSRVAAEFFGTAFLLTAVVGSGIMGERLAGGNVAMALLANSAGDGSGAGCAHSGAGANFGCALQSCGHPRGCDAERHRMARVARLRERSNHWSVRWRRSGSPDVWPACIFRFLPREKRRRSPLERIHRHLRPPGGDLGMRPQPLVRRVCRRLLHFRGLLVHRFYVLCQSRGDVGARSQRYLHRHSSTRRSCVYRRATGRCYSGQLRLSMVGSIGGQSREQGTGVIGAPTQKTSVLFQPAVTIYNPTDSGRRMESHCA